MNPVKIIENFLSSENCNYLIQTYKDKVIRSTVIDENKIQPASKIDAARTSSTFYIPNTDKVIVEIRNKVSKMLMVDTRNIEGVQFLRYLKGERYLYHHDYLKDVSNQRTDTILVYLNDLVEADGGATSFFHYKMKVCPKQGRAAWFKNYENGKLIEESLHSGEEILSDIRKYALNIWIREKPM